MTQLERSQWDFSTEMIGESSMPSIRSGSRPITWPRDSSNVFYCNAKPPPVEHQALQARQQFHSPTGMEISQENCMTSTKSGPESMTWQNGPSEHVCCNKDHPLTN